MKRIVLAFILSFFFIGLSAQVSLEVNSFATYSENLLGVKKGSKAAFYDLDGNKIIDFKIDVGIRDTDIGALRPNYPFFSEGLCKAYDAKTQKYGYIDKTGAWKISPSFIVANDFKEGMTIVLKYINNKDTYFLIDKTGAIKFQFPLNLVPDFEKMLNGRVAVKDRSTNKYGYVDFSGKLIVPCKFSMASFFTEDGLARVNGENQYGEFKYGYIDKSGKLVIDYKFSNQPGDFHGGLAYIRDNEGNHGFINKSGEIVIQPMYSTVFPFEKGITIVQSNEDNTNNSFRIIDVTGKTLAIGNDADPYAGFKNGFAIINNSEGYNYVNTKGELLLTKNVSFASPFSNGAAIIHWTDENYKYFQGIIDSTGKVRIIKVESKY